MLPNPSQSTFFLLLLLFFNFQPISGNIELKALMNIKSALDPENKYLKSWVSSGDPCSGTFEGVACNGDHKVANISLQGKGLAGRLSPAISGLKSLSGLYLHYNSLTGIIPKEIAELTQLTDLYLDVNNLTGIIPPEVGNMESLQVLQLCCNQLSGRIPTQMGSLKKLTALELQYNQLTASIPSTLGDLEILKRIDVSYNHLSGGIPVNIGTLPQLEFLDVRNNCLSGVVPLGLKKLGGGFSYANNPALCGRGFDEMRACTAYDAQSIDTPLPFATIKQNHTDNTSTPPQHTPNSAAMQTECTQQSSSNTSKLTQVIIIVGAVTGTVTVAAAGFLTFIRYRRKKQKIGTTVDASESRFSTDHCNFDLNSKNASPLVSLAYSTGWDPLADGLNSGDFTQEVVQNYRFTMEDVESATHYFNEGNVLGRGSFSTVYRGILRDGSIVAVKSISVTSCKSEEADFVKGINLVTSLRHENLVNLKGFCCSRGRGECFLIYDFVANGNLSTYLDVDENGSRHLDWSTRVSIINGIAKGIHYLHEENANKPAVIHQNISAEKILLDHHFNPLISDPGLRKILADDIIFSALKVSAAMGYLAPEYITTGRFTEQSDVYAFGVIVLQILSGKQKLTGSIFSDAESCKPEELIDAKLKGRFSVSEATKLARLAVSCTNEVPSRRPTMKTVIRELQEKNSGT